MSMNSGYVGWSKSVRAAAAETEEKLPLTRAVAYVAREANVTRKAARAALEEQGPCEWHHCSKFCNRVDYYDCAEVISLLIDPLYAERCEAYSVEFHSTGWLDFASRDSRRQHEWADFALTRERGRDEFLSAASLRLDAEYRGDVAERINHAAAFRRWEAAMLRLAGTTNG